ncbi:MAG: acyl carrier protein [Betaproteobacteria bacterium]
MKSDLVDLLATLMPPHISEEQIRTCRLKDLGMDSMGVLQLFSLLETHYGIEVLDEDISDENFSTLSNLDAYIAVKMSGSGH